MKRLASRSSLLAPACGALAAIVALTALAACSASPSNSAPDASAPADVAPSVNGKSSPQVVHEGNAALFSVTAAGSEPIAYQWQRDGIDIPGAVGRYHVVAAALLADDAARYSVRISNGAGTVVTEVGALLVVARDAPMPWM